MCVHLRLFDIYIWYMFCFILDLLFKYIVLYKLACVLYCLIAL